MQVPGEPEDLLRRRARPAAATARAATVRLRPAWRAPLRSAARSRRSSWPSSLSDHADKIRHRTPPRRSRPRGSPGARPARRDGRHPAARAAWDPCRPRPASASRTTGPRAAPAGRSCPRPYAMPWPTGSARRCTGARVAGGGFTRGFARRADTADGDAVFVKAASLTTQPQLARLVRQRGRDPGPAAGRAARPPAALDGHRRRPVVLWRWTPSTGGLPALPWDPADLAAALAGYARGRRRAGRPAGRAGRARPAPAGRPGPDDFLGGGSSPPGREPMPPGCRPAAARCCPSWSRWSRASPGYSGAPGADPRRPAGGQRADRPAGRAWFCDWNWLCHGPAWFDLAEPAAHRVRQRADPPTRSSPRTRRRPARPPTPWT